MKYNNIFKFFISKDFVLVFILLFLIILFYLNFFNIKEGLDPSFKVGNKGDQYANIITGSIDHPEIKGTPGTNNQTEIKGIPGTNGVSGPTSLGLNNGTTQVIQTQT